MTMKYEPHIGLPGGFGPNDGTIDFYSRVKCQATPNMLVLDLGAGRAGWYEDDPLPYRRSVRTLKGHVQHVIATDVDPVVLQNRSVDECRVMEKNSIPLNDREADLIVADYVLEHVASPAEFSDEVSRVLKPGGWLCARTPHKYNYVSVAARLTRNSAHSNVLRHVQPDRKEIDVFPTCYRLNTMAEVSAAFPGWENQSFIYRVDPSYYFGRRAVYRALEYAHRLAPRALCGNLFIFLRKPQ